MTDKTEAQVAEPDYLVMSDEDFLNAPLPDTTQEEEVKGSGEVAVHHVGEPAQASATEVETNQEQEAEVDEASARTQRADGEEQAAEVKDPKDPKDPKPKVEEVSKGEPGAKKEVRSASGEATGSTKETSEQEADKEEVIDYKAGYERVMAPFKANGKEFKVDSIDDVIQLMQMGANYSKKMGALKPSLKILKALENNDLLNEERINYLIDLSKGDKNAISKLVTEGKLDPMDLDAEKASAYKPNSHAVPDQEVELDSILDELQDSKSYARLTEVVGKEWDEASKKFAYQNPGVLKIIHAQLENGIYDLINTQVEKERMLGRLTGLSNIAAYREVGDRMNAQGVFNHLNLGSSQVQGKPASKTVEPVAKPKQEADDKLNDKRRAASTTQSAAPASKGNKDDFNPLALSDEEFLKQANGKYL